VCVSGRRIPVHTCRRAYGDAANVLRTHRLPLWNLIQIDQRHFFDNLKDIVLQLMRGRSVETLITDLL
jgi:hypothetical protein